MEFPVDGVRLELDGNGRATVYWKNLRGKTQSYACAYEFNEEARMLIATVFVGKEEKNFKVPYENGEITLSETLSGKAFFAKFSKK
jgi:hypothetical protein